MKKLIYSALALAGLLFAASCQQENLEPVQTGNTVTFTVEVPEVATKGLGDNVANIDDLVYAVYSTTATSLEEVQDGVGTYELLYQKNYDNNPFNGSGRTVIQVELVNGKNYFVLFWAQVNDTWVNGTSFDLRSVAYPTEMAANNNNLAAFSGISFLNSENLSAKETVVLKRPFAQVNIGTNLAKNFTLELETSSVKVYNAGTTFNLIKQAAEGNSTVEFATANVPTNPDHQDGKLTVAGQEYTYAAMNYVFANGNVEVEYAINTKNHGTVSNKVSNVPVAANYRTNIVGNLLTSETEYTVVLDKFDENTNSGNMEVLTEGLVKNQNGDYEVSNENGLAYAMNNLMQNGGNFYLTAPEYNMTGISVKDIDFNHTTGLNVYGETPVVTRAASSSTTGVKIVGLPYFIKSVVSGSVSISGVTLVNETVSPVLVETVETTATVVVSDCAIESSTETSSALADLIKSGSENVVAADDVKNHEEFNKAYASGVKTIKLGDDLNTNQPITLTKTIIIDGNGKTLTYTGTDRAIDVPNNSDVTVDVTVKNLTVVATTANRGLNYNDNGKFNVENVKVTLGVNRDGYAINFPGMSDGAAVTIRNSELTSRNPLNIWGENMTIDVYDSKIESVDNSETYNYAAIQLNNEIPTVGPSGAVANGTVVNVYGGKIIAYDETKQESAIVANATETGVVNISGDTEVVGNIVIYVANIGGVYFANLQEAVEAIEKYNYTSPIVLMRSFATSEIVTIKNGLNVTIDLNGKTITGTDTTSKNFSLIDNRGNLTIKNGTLTLTATVNSGWSRYSAVLANNPGGNLTVESNVVLEHLGGTDMAYGIDNLTNGDNTSAITTINGATVKSTYRAVRQFLNGNDPAVNKLYVKSGSTLQGDNNAIFFHGPTAKKPCSGKLVVEEGANIYGDVYLFVTEGSTTWPVDVSVAASAIKEGTVTYKNVPDGYSVVNIDGTWKVVPPVGTQEAFADAVAGGATEVYLAAGNYTMPEPDLRGKTLTIKGSKDVVIDATAVDARDQFVTGATLKFEGVTLNFGKVNYMGFANTASLTYKDCNINGLQFLYGAKVEFENCSLNSDGAEHTVWTYGAQNVSFTKCDFTYGDRGVNCYSDNDVTGGKQTVNFTECTFTTENTASAGAVEINSCYFSVGIEVNMDECTAPAYGEMAYVSPWDSTNGSKTTINIK